MVAAFFIVDPSTKGTEPGQRYTSAIVSTRGDSVRLRCGVDVTVSRRARQAVSRQERRQSEAGLQQEDGRGVEPIFPENASLLTEREILPPVRTCPVETLLRRPSTPSSGPAKTP